MSWDSSVLREPHYNFQMTDIMPATGGALFGMAAGGWVPYLLMQKGAILKGAPQKTANAAVYGGVIAGTILGKMR